MEYLANLDSQLFFFINHLPHTMVVDQIALGLSGFGNSWIIWVLLGVYVLVKTGWHDYKFPFFFCITVGGAYMVSDVFMKPMIARIRPSIVLDALVVVTSPLDYSFPSTHAVVAFAAATLLSFKYPNARVVVYMLAFLVSLSRIYLGYHYPLDVVVGAIMGWFIGMLGTYWMRKNTL